jgi:hypothetical protein
METNRCSPGSRPEPGFRELYPFFADPRADHFCYAPRRPDHV